jgi:hypothetical protein
LKSTTHILPKTEVKTDKINPHQVLPLGKVFSIEMRQLARGYVDERLTVTIRQIRIIKAYGGIFLLGAAAFVLAIILLVSLGGMI